MTSLEKQLTKAIERLQNEHSEQMQSLKKQVEVLTEHVSELTHRYNNLVTILNQK